MIVLGGCFLVIVVVIFVVLLAFASHEKVYYSTPVVGFADMFVLVCSVR